MEANVIQEVTKMWMDITYGKLGKENDVIT